MVRERRRDRRVPLDREALDGDRERQHHGRGRGEVDAYRCTHVGVGPELALVERPRGHADERPGDDEQAGERRRTVDRTRPDDERNPRHADRNTDFLPHAQALVQPARDDDSGEERLQGEDQCRDARRQAPALRVVAAAEVAGVAEQAGDRDVPHCAAVFGQRARRPKARIATTRAML